VIRRHQTLPAASVNSSLRADSEHSAELELQKVKIERDELRSLYEELSLDHGTLSSENVRFFVVHYP